MDECLQLGTSPKKEIRNQVLPINLTHFIFTVDMLFSLIFFHNVCIFAKTTALFICIFIQKDPSFLPFSRKAIQRTQRF